MLVFVMIAPLLALSLGGRAFAFATLSPRPTVAPTTQTYGEFNGQSQPVPQQNSLLQYVQALGPYVGLIAALIAAGFLIKRGRLDARNAFAAEILKFRLRQIQDFYAPASLDIEESRIVYEKLLWMLEKNKALELKNFRLLDHIHTFSTDSAWTEYKPLIDKILKIGQHLTKLITKNAGLIEGGITDTFVQYEAHFNILNAAAKQRLSDADLDGSHEFGYYPRMLNREIREGYKVVLDHLKRYADAGDQIIADLTNDKTFRDRAGLGRHRAYTLETLHYYEQHAESYAAKFDEFDLSKFRERLLREIRSKKSDEVLRVLDAGSGTGRDLVAFVYLGCNVVGIDASPAMLRECRRKLREARTDSDTTVQRAATNSECLEMSFDEMRFRNEFDGVWAAASLLHVPKFQIRDIAQRLMRALKTNGVCYMSLKFGTGEGERDSRFFAYYHWGEIRRLISDIGNAEVADVWLSKPNGDNLTNGEQLWARILSVFGYYDRKLWINVLARRKQT